MLKEEQKLNLKKNKCGNTERGLWLERIVSAKFVEAVKSKSEIKLVVEKIVQASI